MPSEYDNTNKGILYPNNYKKRSNQPDVKGKINVDGVECELAGWVREKDGTRYFSLIVEKKEKEEQQLDSDPIGSVIGTPSDETPSTEAAETKTPINDEDVPF